MNKRLLLLIAYLCVYDSIPEICLEKLDGQVGKQSTCRLILIEIVKLHSIHPR